MRTSRRLGSSLAFLVVALGSRSALATVINVSPADGNTGYTKIEGANPGDEVILAPGTYPFRVYLTQTAPANNPIYIHSQDPSNPAIVDLSGGTGALVDNAPGSYTAGDKARGCWQLSGATNIHIDGIVFQNCHAASNDSAGIRYYNGSTGVLLTNSLFKANDNGLTGGTLGGAGGNTQCDATVEWSEFDGNGNLAASSSSPTHNIYIYGGNFTLRYSYLHDPIQGQNLHCRAITSSIEYNWLARAKSYAGDLMTNDDYANNPVGSITQTMTMVGNVFNQGSTQANDGQVWAVYNDEASGSPVTFRITMNYNTLVGAGGHAAMLHLSNADATEMDSIFANNVVSGTSVATLIEDSSHAALIGGTNWMQTGTPVGSLTGTVFGSSPGFSNAASLDFVPTAASACVGAANDTVSPVPLQEYYENETVTREYRQRATAKDIGAFEHDTSGAGIGPYMGVDGGIVESLDSGTPGSDGGTVTGQDGGVVVGRDGGSGGTGDAGSGTHGKDGGSGGQGSKDGGFTVFDGGLHGDGVPPTSSSSGCSCRLGGAGEVAGGGAWVLGVVGLVIRRRRRS